MYILGNLLSGDDSLSTVLDMFSAMIQSGKDVFIDQNTKLKVYTFNPPNVVGSNTLFFTSNMTEFLRKCKSVVEIKSSAEGNMCFSFAFTLGLAQLKDGTDRKGLYKKFVNHAQRPSADTVWRDTAVALHTTVLELNPQSFVTWREMKFLEQYYEVGIHVYNISGVRPHFTYHSSRALGLNKHLYFLQVGHHVHYISNITGLLRLFTRNKKTEYCVDCYKVYDRRYLSTGGHICDQEDDAEETDSTSGQKMCTIGNRTFPYFPKIGVPRTSESIYIQRTKEKEATGRKIIYLDFETTVTGYAHVTLETEVEEDETDEILAAVDTNTNRRREPPLAPYELPVENVFTYEPYPFLPRFMNTTEYEYIQEVNYCEAQYVDGSVFTFRTIEQVMEWLNEPEHKGSIVIAHCGGGFDFQLLLRQFLTNTQLRMKKVKYPLLRGNKIITAEIQNDITLLDSYAFVAHALAKFPKIFSIEEEKKGYFPHLFNRTEFYNYKGSIPSWEWYDPDTFSVEKRKEFFKWYEEQVENQVVFDFQIELVSYCHSDVQLLRLGMEKFRELFLTLTKADGTPIGVDPYNHLTIPSVAFEGIYLKYFLPENTIITVPRPSADNHSFKSLLWMEYVMSTSTEYIQHAGNLGEYEVVLHTGKKVKVDGYCAATSTVYQFHGCFWHGCCYCYEADKGCPHRVRTYVNRKGKEMTVPIKFGELYTHTFQISDWIRSAGYKLVEIWECQWDAQMKRLNINTTRADLENNKPLVPRHAYFGGRVNAVKLYYKCEGDEQIKYMDITSMYPFVMSAPQYLYPVKTPTILKKGRDNMLPLEQLFGLIKCEILPPDDLYFPVLPERCPNTAKVQFHLKKMIGTWTSIEVQRAVQKGYTVLDVFEQHHFEHQSNELFREYNETFFEIKRTAKEQGNKGLEAIAKMCINGPTGKWGFNPEKQKGTRLVTECDEFYTYLCGSWEKVSINIITDGAATVQVEDNNEFTEHSKSNVYISAFITAYSRLKLYDEALDKLKSLVLYFDTDSVIYVSPNGEDLISADTTGQMGLWTSEADEGDHFTEFVSCGPKTYALKSFSTKKDISKSKGFSLHYNNQKIFNFDSLKEQVLYKALSEDLDVMEFEERMTHQHKKPRLEKLVLHAKETIMRRKKFQVMVEENKGKVINLTYDKRKIINPDEDYDKVVIVETKPWGHRDISHYLERIKTV